MTNDTVKARPIIKWAGGKTQMLNDLRAALPEVPWSGRYVEPFIGGGALFFDLDPERAWISDVNPELIHMYRMIVSDVDGVIACLRDMPNDQEFFLRIRRMSFPEAVQQGAAFAAARMIYLNRTAFNGLYRQDRQGRFNVPFGRYANPRILHEEGLRAAQAVLARTDITCMGFAEVMEQVGEGDVVFLDPPYVPMSATAGFHHYVAGGFNGVAHRVLHDAMADASARGAHVILTNSAAPLVYDIFGDMDIRTIDTRRNIAAKAASRTGKDTLIICPAYAEHTVHRAPLFVDVGQSCWVANTLDDRICVPSLGIDHVAHERLAEVNAALGSMAPILPNEVVPYALWSYDDADQCAKAIRFAREASPEIAAADRAFRVADVIASGIESGIPKRSMVKMLHAMEALVG